MAAAILPAWESSDGECTEPGVLSGRRSAIGQAPRKPLGIEDPTWDASKQGVSMGGFGLNIRTEDIARFGELYLRKGAWHGKQLVPAGWVEAATTKQVSNGSSPSSDWEQGYGYQFWRSRHGFYRGDGAHGQYCLVLPQYDAVIAITSGTRDMASVMNLAWEKLVPALQQKPLPADTAAQKRLAARLAALTLRPAAGAPTTAVAGAVAGKRYVFESNPQSIEALVLQPPARDGSTVLTVRIAGIDRRIEARAGGWEKGTAPGPQGADEPIAASAAWTATDTYTLKVARYRTPFVTTYTLRFAGDELTVESEQNVGPAESRVAKLTARVQRTSSP
jgi:hypothetical protein